MRQLRNILFIAFLLSPALAYAQFLPEPVQYVITPEVPGPNQRVTIEAQGVGTFLGDAQITWQQDGKTTLTGVGERIYNFTTGAMGSVTRVHVSIQSQNGSFSKDLVFRPSTVSLVWEADTSVPPLYRGKPLYSAGSALKVVAFPSVIINGSKVAAQSLSYQWTRQDQAVPDQSGTGRSSLSIQGDQLQPSENIGVDVYFGTLLVARGSVSIPASQPAVALYERDALRGTLTDSALPPSISLTGKEITIAAQPYFFSTSALKSGLLQYTWNLNGSEITGPDSSRGILTLRQTGNGNGSANLSVNLQNNANDQIVQAADTLLHIVFGGSASSGSLFGL